jgi:type IV pilus biogenesis protein CpaD/CtpE
MKQHLLTIVATTALMGCATIPPEAYVNRGSPESLLDVSSEVVNLDVSSEQARAELSSWVEEDAPTRAELYCADDVGSSACAEAESIMQLYGIPYQQVSSAEQMAVLIYERVLARDCVNRYIDNAVNPYHLNHPSFGCSTAVNMVQHVTDRRQFIRPNLLDSVDAKKAVQAYDVYMTPPNPPSDGGISDSLLNEAGSQ